MASILGLFSCWVKLNEIHCFSIGQQLVVPGERFMVFFVKHNCLWHYYKIICSVLNLCTFALARVLDNCAEHLEA